MRSFPTDISADKGGKNGGRRKHAGALKQAFETLGTVRKVAKGEYLHRAGDPPQSVFLMRNGWVCRERLANQHTYAITAVLLRGDFVGLDGIYGQQVTDDIRALTSCVVQELPLSVLEAESRADPAVAQSIICHLTLDGVFLREALVAIGRQLAPARICTFIAQTYDRLVDASLITSDAARFDLPLKQTDMAAVLGLTPIHAHRIIKEHRERGSFDFRAERVTIGDMPLVRKLAQS
ncbi:Anaerobic regulatory protein [Alteripontixanthobacter maritimus]|uniref:Anaerobic regulatory protein n=2 Tax=Alteripontixanthobacter maritimus TaxID=2161824 RepID=A0A369Q711_9SPHN|nr:Anaerobic regulatory protein [Alteripontixanthobacter maritimus]